MQKTTGLGENGICQIESLVQRLEALCCFDYYVSVITTNTGELQNNSFLSNLCKANSPSAQALHTMQSKDHGCTKYSSSQLNEIEWEVCQISNATTPHRSASRISFRDIDGTFGEQATIIFNLLEMLIYLLHIFFLTTGSEFGHPVRYGYSCCLERSCLSAIFWFPLGKTLITRGNPSSVSLNHKKNPELTQIRHISDGWQES